MMEAPKHKLPVFVTDLAPKPLIDLVAIEREPLSRTEMLGRIFDKMLDGLAAIERRHLENPGRDDADFQDSALQCLGVIGIALREAKRVGASPLEADHLPGPLHRLASELRDVFKGHRSSLLMPAGSRDRPKSTPATNRNEAFNKALAIETYFALKRAGWTERKAAEEIAKLFRDAGVRVNGKSQARGPKRLENELFTAETVKRWCKEAQKKNGSEAANISVQRQVIRKHVEELFNIREVIFGAGRYTPTPEDKAEVVLASLRKTIRENSFVVG
jgi:hypothetical protein